MSIGHFLPAFTTWLAAALLALLLGSTYLLDTYDPADPESLGVIAEQTADTLQAAAVGNAGGGQ